MKYHGTDHPDKRALLYTGQSYRSVKECHQDNDESFFGLYQSVSDLWLNNDVETGVFVLWSAEGTDWAPGAAQTWLDTIERGITIAIGLHQSANRVVQGVAYPWMLPRELYGLGKFPIITIVSNLVGNAVHSAIADIQHVLRVTEALSVMSCTHSTLVVILGWHLQHASTILPFLPPDALRKVCDLKLCEVVQVQDEPRPLWVVLVNAMHAGAHGDVETDRLGMSSVAASIVKGAALAHSTCPRSVATIIETVSRICKETQDQLWACLSARQGLSRLEKKDRKYCLMAPFKSPSGELLSWWAWKALLSPPPLLDWLRSKIYRPLEEVEEMILWPAWSDPFRWMLVGPDDLEPTWFKVESCTIKGRVVRGVRLGLHRRPDWVKTAPRWYTPHLPVGLEVRLVITRTHLTLVNKEEKCVAKRDLKIDWAQHVTYRPYIKAAILRGIINIADTYSYQAILD
ncbi:hypothetical protein C8R43DRAFT_944465 [Mycena crocata]|nr:hypothetical protein C8R43DRAFT_944465 [Mycena crocata]